MENYLNDINVFPVADGDTGTNMVATMNSIMEGVKKCKKTSFAEMSFVIANSALKGARGNSGAILAQYFQGLAEATKGKIRLSTKAFATAALKAADQARQAIYNPQEGTIITVMKDWANHLIEHAPHTPDFVELFKKSLSKARESLAETPNKLAILKKAGVVDAGAQGFVNLIEGIVNYIEYGRIKPLKSMSFSANKIKKFDLVEIAPEINFQFCSECLIEGIKLDREAIRRTLSSFGDSLIIAGSKEKVHIHIHTDNPDKVFSRLSEFGTVEKIKVDDMYQQYRQNKKNRRPSNIGLVTDSTCDLPPELIKEHNIHVVPIVIQVGKESYLDQVEIKPKDFSRLLQTSNKKLSTSQPPPASFERIYNKIADKYESIISLHLSEKLSGTIQASRVGAKSTNYYKKIFTVDSKTSTIALGLMLIETARLIKEGYNIKEIINKLKILAKKVKIFVSIPTLKYLMKSGRLSRTKGLLGTIINLKPVISIDDNGYIIEAAKTIGQKRVVRKTLDLAVKFAKSVKNPRFGIAHVSAPELAQWYSGKIQTFFNSSKIIITEASPALSVHIGIGGAVIAVLGD
ncbi:MAG: DegV family protein [Candidatus Caldatribacteriota bacterium]|nr:DegV family protein [Candidatus Caldatribacteriota bacterium]